MALVHNQLADRRILDYMLANDDNYKKIKLYKNNHTPAVGDLVGDYDEADFDGYGEITLAWSAAFTNGDGKGQITGDSCTWVRGAGATSNTIYGVYVVDYGGDLMYAEKFPAPISMTVPFVDTVYYQPIVTAVNES